MGSPLCSGKTETTTVTGQRVGMYAKQNLNQQTTNNLDKTKRDARVNMKGTKQTNKKNRGDGREYKVGKSRESRKS